MSEILIRPARIEDCPALGRIIVAATQDAFRGLVPDLCLEWLTPEESAANWAKNFQSEQSLAPGDFLFVAETKRHRVIGFAMLCELSADNEQDSHNLKAFSHDLASLQVDPTWQRQGVGRRLLSHVAGQMWSEGATHLLVRVLAENPNRGFYEHLGALQLGSRPYEWEGYMTEEILYGWDDMHGLRNTI
ncbi:MAG TPA: GNAT family N-acetyltransferase [Chloroflexota bacterium]|nr:GNAT family N-acetyltransferase [Chloroflexota bacterium]